MNNYLRRFNNFPSSVSKHVFVPEIERLEKAFAVIPVLIQNKEMTLDDIAKASDMTLTELKYGQWESLYNYIRGLEQQVQVLNALNDKKEKKMRDLVLFVENTSQNIIKLYRETSYRNSND